MWNCSLEVGLDTMNSPGTSETLTLRRLSSRTSTAVGALSSGRCQSRTTLLECVHSIGQLIEEKHAKCIADRAASS